MLWSTILKQLFMAAIPTIIEIGKKFFDKINDAPPVNENNTANDIEQIGAALVELREHVIKQSKPAIDNANDSITNYIEEQIFLLDDKAKLFDKYEISTRSVEYKLQEIKRRTSDFWRDALQLKISLDDPVCRNILMMPSGEMKAKKIAAFTDEVLAKTLEEYAELVRRELANLYADFEEEVGRTVARIEGTVDNYAAMVQSLEEKDDEKFESLIATAQAKVFCYDAILEKVRA